MTIFSIKIIAYVTMILDHIKYAIPSTQNFITINLGRISFPLFAFLITEGYLHTKDLKKYYKRIILFGIISQLPFMYFRTLVGEWKMLNIMFTLLFGLICITVFDKFKKKYLAMPLIILIIYIGEIINVDYGWFGITSVFVMYLLRNKKMFLPLIYGILIILFYYYLSGEYVFATENLIAMAFAWSSTFIINSYNGKQGRKMKYFFYWIYPIHLVLLDLVSLIAK